MKNSNSNIPSPKPGLSVDHESSSEQELLGINASGNIPSGIADDSIEGISSNRLALAHSFSTPVVVHAKSDGSVTGSNSGAGSGTTGTAGSNSNSGTGEIQLRLLPLQGHSVFLSGRYGLELTLCQGIVRILYSKPCKVQKLTISLQSILKSFFCDSIQKFDSVTRETVLFQNQVVLLEKIDLIVNSHGFVDIPFEIQFPLYNQITKGFGPCHELLPNVFTIAGKGLYHDFKGSSSLSLTCTLSIQGLSLFNSSSYKLPIPYTIKTDLNFTNFITYDPRLIPQLLYPEERRWKSHLNAHPCEYDISISSAILGPYDFLTFSYRCLVHPALAHTGVRLRSLTLALKESTTIGEARCCSLDDAPDSWRHSKPLRVRGSRDVYRWSQMEYPPPGFNPYTPPPPPHHCYPSPPPRNTSYYGTDSINTKYHGLAVNDPDSIYPGNDGIYVSRTISIQMPGAEEFTPTSAMLPLPPDDSVCSGKRPRGAYVNIRHSFVVTIEMRGAESVSIEAGCYLSSVGKKDIEGLFEKGDEEIVPCLDYKKMTGLEEWVPSYEPDTTLGMFDGRYRGVSPSHREEDPKIKRKVDLKGKGRMDEPMSPPPDYLLLERLEKPIVLNEQERHPSPHQLVLYKSEDSDILDLLDFSENNKRRNAEKPQETVEKELEMAMNELFF